MRSSPKLCHYALRITNYALKKPPTRCRGQNKFSSVFVAEFAELQPQRPRNEYRRVTAAEEANNQRERKIFRRFAAEEKQRKRREQAREDRVQRTRQCLVN